MKRKMTKFQLCDRALQSAPNHYNGLSGKRRFFFGLSPSYVRGTVSGEKIDLEETEIPTQDIQK